jgi:hypothetical protein
VSWNRHASRTLIRRTGLTPAGFLLLNRPLVLRRLRTLADLNFRVVDVSHHLYEIAHLEPLPARRQGIHKMVGLDLGAMPSASVPGLVIAVSRRLLCAWNVVPRRLRGVWAVLSHLLRIQIALLLGRRRTMERGA